MAQPSSAQVGRGVRASLSHPGHPPNCRDRFYEPAATREREKGEPNDARCAQVGDPDRPRPVPSPRNVPRTDFLR
jgi:hypothetical protein